jgi:diguanylate cyclase (GGDEF)-like protein
MAEPKRSILVVDDEQPIRTMLQEALSTLGYECAAIGDGVSALALLRKSTFDIMLTDITMPGMSGLELTRNAKRLRPDMPVIVMTGFIGDFSFDDTMEAGASDFIKKPFTLKELALRIEHVKMQEKLREMLITDELTGLYNRRGFFTLAEHIMREARRSRKGFFLLYADADGLKTVNDTFGHSDGDRVLTEIARILKTTCRESDVIARIGGDEFAIIPVGASRSDVETIISRLQAAFDVCDTGASNGYRISASIGITFFDPEGPGSVDDLLAAGDRMMYNQKKLRQSL